jgi:hypothetical protein
MAPRRLALASVALLMFVGGCASAGNTLAQDLAWERWEKCKNQVGPRVTLQNIRADGQIYLYHYSGGELDVARECLRKAAEEQARRPGAIAPPQVSAVAVPGTPAPHSQPLAVRPGSEWAYRWETPQGKGTFVYVLDREEIRDGAAFYVIKSGTRELFYRKPDLALSLETVEGAPEMRRSPPVQILKWPLVVGAEWEQTYTLERVKLRQTEEIQTKCAIEKEETITVPAGTFQTFKAVCRNRRTGVTLFESWYAPQVGSFVRDLSLQTSGAMRERELLEYRLK